MRGGHQSDSRLLRDMGASSMQSLLPTCKRCCCRCCRNIQVQRSNELLRKESQARTVGMRNLVHAVNRNLAVTEHLVTASGGKLGAVPSIVGGRLAPSWQKVLDPTSLDHLRMQHAQQHQQLARAWQEPVPAAQLVQSLRTLPGDKWDDTRDLRLGVWNVPGLRFRGSGVSFGKRTAERLVSSEIRAQRLSAQSSG